MKLTPLNHYQTLIDSGTVQKDPDQLLAVQAMDDLWHRLQGRKPLSLFERIRGKRPQVIEGIYLWGTVGRGKTWLMDLFFELLPTRKKQRLHFHRFMKRVHNDLKLGGDVRDPLPRIARSWAEHCEVLCLDEFFVSDIADAMLLAGLLEALFDHGVTLVTTSNIEPDNLYRDGLQRARFLPAIDLLKQHLKTVELAGNTDFRLRILKQSPIYHTPLSNQAQQLMAESFDRMSTECELAQDLEINGRLFHARRRSDGIIWFDFNELCEKPRGSVDYIEIARSFNTVLLSDVTQMQENEADSARRFIIMIDEFYDRNVKLLITADQPIDQLYTGKRLFNEFQRTRSRLTEMQSHDYLAKPHLS